MSETHSIKAVGVGGSGCSTVERMAACGGCHPVAVHTDAMSLLERKVPTKVLIGKNITKGRSTGNNSRLGEEAAIADRDKIAEIIGDTEIVFLIAGLGGGTGAGASPIVAEVAKSKGATVIAFVNIPFTAEGKVCKGNAQAGLDNLKPYCDLIVLIENDRFLKIVPDLSIRDAFTKVNQMVFEAVRGMVNLVNNTGLDNLKPLFQGYATLGHGFGPTLKKACEVALYSPLIGADIRKSNGLLLNLITHSKKISGINEALEYITTETNPEIKIIWSNTVDDSTEAVEVLALFSGVNPTY